MAITRLWQSGWESGSVNEIYLIRSASISSAQVKTGTYSILMSDTGLGSSGAGGVVLPVPSTRQFRVGWWMYGAPSGIYTDKCWTIASLDSGSSIVCGLRMRYQANAAYLWTSIEVDSFSPISESSFHHYGIDIKVDSSNGWLYFYYDGSLKMSFDGNTGNSDIESIGIGSYYLSNGSTSYWDDIYVDDTTGEGSPAIVPILRFYPLTLDGNGNYAQWDGSDGNSTDNYQLVDEVPPSDTDYVETNVVDEYDSYTMTGITLDTGQTINAVIPVVRAAKAGSTEQVALGTRLSSTDSIGSDQNPPTSFGYLSERQTTKPGGGSWGESDVNGAELVIKSRGSY
jgi:hypothetical protein